MDRSVEALWRRRAGAFWRESIPYFRDMTQSGLPGVVIMLLLAGLAGYALLLRNMPANFPFTLVGVIVLTPVLCWSPLRTWLREADIVFLVPREAEMRAYLRRSFRYNGLACFAAVLLVCAVYMPLYLAGPATTPALVIGLFALLLKLMNSGAAWRERQLAGLAARRTIRVLRWAATAVAAGALLQTELWKTAVYLVVVGGLFALLYSRLSRYPVPWLALIAEEQTTRRRYMAFFSAFADVPTESAAVRSRRYASWLTRFVPYGKSRAFTYLYAHTLVRTELGGIILRLTGLGMVSGMLSAYAGLWQGWGSAAVCLLFVWLSGIQLGSLAQSHKHSVWRLVYPLPDRTRHDAVLRVDRVASLICAVLIWLPHGILLPGRDGLAPALAALAVALVYVLALRPRRIRKLLTFDPDDD
ncbi:ABC-2 type transport system permease protein [Paenibacillus sp. UNC496MF]|uniref:ABC transporter permease n=1 Tax=Paenibacillus sp. UNC496MF TaxID=1502753 RepID=UPI0008E52325|nr:ABC transporter permease [Paenibacillus sp. UNC496MF]SFJ02865.1 ABC-2 type transport system permease protein [Paenibacillus sp. UNC496MF]